MGNLKEIGLNISAYSKKNAMRIGIRVILMSTLLGAGYEIVGRQGRDIQPAIDRIKEAVHGIGKDCRIELPDGKTTQEPECRRILPPPAGPWGF